MCFRHQHSGTSAAVRAIAPSAPKSPPLREEGALLLLARLPGGEFETFIRSIAYKSQFDRSSRFVFIFMCHSKHLFKSLYFIILLENLIYVNCFNICVLRFYFYAFYFFVFLKVRGITTLLALLPGTIPGGLSESNAHWYG